MTLKTLKDMEERIIVKRIAVPEIKETIVNVKWLKQEAIKWAKFYQNEMKELDKKYPIVNGVHKRQSAEYRIKYWAYQRRIAFIKDFFNITEDDLCVKQEKVE